MHPRSTRARLVGIITVLAACVLSSGQNQPGATAPATQTTLDPKVDKILTRLEGREIRDLRARVSWKLRYVLDLEDEAVTKTGRLWYQQQEPVAKFMVHFDQKISANRLHKLDERHLFDGRWYVELKSQTKTVTRREIRRPGESRDPYKLGEGPFPLPFGQKKADILREFDVTLVPPEENDPPDSDHLRLDPRPGSETGRSYKLVDVWVAREGPQHGLPVKLHTSKKDGTGQVNSFITISFDDVMLNQGFSSSIFEIRTPRGYHEETEELGPITPPPASSAPTTP